MQLTATPYNQTMTSSIPTLKRPLNQPFDSTAPVFPTSYPAQARTFNTNIKDVVQSSEVVVGTHSVNTIKSKVLFDARATRHFIYQTFALKLNY